MTVTRGLSEVTKKMILCLPYRGNVSTVDCIHIVQVNEKYLIMVTEVISGHKMKHVSLWP